MNSTQRASLTCIQSIQAVAEASGVSTRAVGLVGPAMVYLFGRRPTGQDVAAT